MVRTSLRDWLRSVDRAEPEEQWALLCFLAGRRVALETDERNAAVRRAELLLASGGDPRRRLELYGRAVTALAEDLDDPGLRAMLGEGLAELEASAAGLRGTSEALRLLQGDADLAWQAFAMSILAEELADAEES